MFRPTSTCTRRKSSVFGTSSRRNRWRRSIGPWEGPDVHNWLAAHLPNATLARELNAGRMFRPLLKASREWQVGQAVPNPVLGKYEKLYWYLEAHILIAQAGGDTAQAVRLVQVQEKSDTAATSYGMGMGSRYPLHVPIPTRNQKV